MARLQLLDGGISNGRQLWHELSQSRATIIVGLVVLCFVANRPPFSYADAAILLSYQQEQGADRPEGWGVYGRGRRDFCFIAFYAAVMIAVRHLLVRSVQSQLARLVKASSKKRAAEQLLQLTYFFASSTFGILTLKDEEIWNLDVPKLQERTSSGTMAGNVKLLYLVETAWWVNESAVLTMGLEKRRKDFKVLACHHVTTLALLTVSYWFDYTDFGLMILVPHGASDALLSLAKFLTYFNAALAAPVWLIFVLVWVYCRHYLMIRALILAVHFHVHLVSLKLSQLRQWLDIGCIMCLALLQLLNLFWLFLIVKGLSQAIVSRDHREDIRSEDEADED